MTRHAKNCTAGSVYTYHEKMKDMKMVISDRVYLLDNASTKSILVYILRYCP